jgi:PLP dependent protein
MMNGDGGQRAVALFRSSFIIHHSSFSSMPDIAVRIAENVARVRGQIADAAARSGRTADQITLVAVTKYVSAELVRPLVAAGCTELGESRPQQLWEKAAQLADLPIRWHLVGQLQRNKVRRTLPLVAMIHSIDSPRLLAAIEEECGAKMSPLPPGEGQGERADPALDQPSSDPRIQSVRVLLEVNISGEQAKHGFQPEMIEPLLAELAGYRHLEVRGLMCMAALEGGLDVARRDFAALRDLRDRLRCQCPPGVTLDELSMGMSGDFEVAIEEGATIVRVGSALFEGAI